MVELKVINQRIRIIGNGEKTFRIEMATLSRELLEYIPATGDISALNRLLDVMTKKHAEQALKFFSRMLPWNVDHGKFTNKSKNVAAVDKKLVIISEFLKNAENTIWTWLDAQARPSAGSGDEEGESGNARPKNYAEKIGKLATAAIKDENEGLDIKGVLRALIVAGATLSQIVEAFAAIQHEVEEEAALAHENDNEDGERVAA